MRSRPLEAIALNFRALPAELTRRAERRVQDAAQPACGSLGIVEQWSVRARSRDAERRAVAAECFGLLDPDVGSFQLRKMLDDSSPHVRGVALRSILRTASEREATQLLDRLAELPNLVRVFVAGELRDRVLASMWKCYAGKSSPMILQAWWRS